MKKICFIVTTPLIVNFFLRKHIEGLSQKFNISLICKYTEDEKHALQSLKLSSIIYIPISREINIISDLLAFVRLVSIFRRNKYNAIHSISPKAGLLATVAGWLSGIPFRIHIFTGQVWSSKTGMARELLKFMDKIIVRFSTDILIDGFSQRNFLIKEKIISRNQAVVFGQGSISGVDNNRFTRRIEERNTIRRKLHIEDSGIVFIFVGRIKKDKGILDLVEAFKQLSIGNNSVYLLIVGYDEENLIKQILVRLENCDRCFYYGSTSTPEYLLSAADVFCLPSYREGFGTSVLEASCCGLPVICSNTYGLEDTIVENVTGLRHNVGDVDDLVEKMKQLADNKELRLVMGKQGRDFVIKNFSADLLTHAWMRFYEEKFKENK